MQLIPINYWITSCSIWWTTLFIALFNNICNTNKIIIRHIHTHVYLWNQSNTSILLFFFNLWLLLTVCYNSRSMLSILEHNASILGSMKSIIGKNFGKSPKVYWANFSAYLTQAYHQSFMLATDGWLVPAFFQLSYVVMMLRI